MTSPTLEASVTTKMKSQTLQASVTTSPPHLNLKQSGQNPSPRIPTRRRLHQHPLCRLPSHVERRPIKMPVRFKDYVLNSKK